MELEKKEIVRDTDEFFKLKDKYLFFYGHFKCKQITETCQWYSIQFTLDNIIFKNAEQAMIHYKAILFKDFDIANLILDYGYNPKKAKQLGRKVRNFNNDIWDKNKLQIVEKVNLAKFSQNENLKDFLLSTKNKILVEASPYIWGIGLSKTDENRFDESKWKGENLLGKYLMKVRNLL